MKSFRLWTVVVALTIVACQNPLPTSSDLADSRAALTPSTLQASFRQSSVWPNGSTTNVTIVNSGTSTVETWRLTFTLPAGTTVTNLWNGQWQSSGTSNLVVSLDYNKTIAPGARVELGYNTLGTALPTQWRVTTPNVSPSPTPTASPSTSPSPSPLPTPSPTLSPSPAATPSPTPPVGYRLVWSDEFNASGAVDSSKWVYDLGGGGWGNGELQTYTNSTNNVFQNGQGHLVLSALSQNGQYTSGRIKTKGKHAWTYGKIEMRAKLPYGQGIWPAFWLLGSDIDAVQWPNCGEIDVMENIGKAAEQRKVYGTIHGPGYSGGGGIGASYTGPRFADDFHTFAIEWEANAIRWYVDGTLYQTRTPSDLGGRTWVFRHDFFVILNLAVGGGWPGNPDSSTIFPQDYVIDYVRVYQK